MIMHNYAQVVVICTLTRKINMKPYLTLVIVLFMSVVGITSSFATDESRAFTTVDAETLRPLLNSERIKIKFGSYAIDVIKNKKNIRMSNLYSSKNGENTTRTLAVVTYPEQLNPKLSKEHQAIVSGQSLGAVFKRSGWKIEKKHVYFGEVDSSKALSKVYSLMGGIRPTNLSIHIYDFYVNKNGSALHYATISEVHHPVYLNSSDLKEIYSKEFDKYHNRSDLATSILRRVELEMERI